MGSPLYQPFPMLAGRSAQVWQHQPAFQRPRHFHAEPEFNVVLSGCAVMGVGHHQVTMFAGDVLFLRPGQDHIMLDASSDLDLFVMAASPQMADAFGASIVPTVTSSLRLDATATAHFSESLVGVRDLTCRSAHDEVVRQMFSWAKLHHPPGHSLARRALGRLYQSPERSAGELAEELRVSASELSRYFHRDLGVRFVETRARVKLMRFVECVDAGASLTQAAHQAQFGSYAQCHRVFRQHLGCTPQDFFKGARTQINALTIS